METETKICSKCKDTKSILEFSKCKNRPDGLQHMCKSCTSQYRIDNLDRLRKQKKEYREKNLEKVKAQKKEYREKNLDRIKKRDKKYYEENREKHLNYFREHYKTTKHTIRKEYIEKNKEKLNKQHKEYLKNNKEVTFCRRIFDRILKNTYGHRAKYESLMGYTIQDLKLHLKQFGEYTQEMHIDHIIPISYLAEYIKDSDILARFSNDLRNLMLLTKKENLSKSNNLTTEFIPDFHLPAFIEYCLEVEEYIDLVNSFESNSLAA